MAGLIEDAEYVRKNFRRAVSAIRRYTEELLPLCDRAGKKPTEAERAAFKEAAEAFAECKKRLKHVADWGPVAAGEYPVLAIEPGAWGFRQYEDPKWDELEMAMGVAAAAVRDDLDTPDNPPADGNQAKEPITIKQAAALIGLEPKTLRNRMPISPPPAAIETKGRENVYQYREFSAWIIDNWPDYAIGLPAEYSEAQKRFTSGEVSNGGTIAT